MRVFHKTPPTPESHLGGGISQKNQVWVVFRQTTFPPKLYKDPAYA